MANTAYARLVTRVNSDIFYVGGRRGRTGLVAEISGETYILVRANGTINPYRWVKYGNATSTSGLDQGYHWVEESDTASEPVCGYWDGNEGHSVLPSQSTKAVQIADGEYFWMKVFGRCWLEGSTITKGFFIVSDGSSGSKNYTAGADEYLCGTAYEDDGNVTTETGFAKGFIHLMGA